MDPMTKVQGSQPLHHAKLLILVSFVEFYIFSFAIVFHLLYKVNRLWRIGGRLDIVEQLFSKKFELRKSVKSS